ncbi:hypothetical protein AB0A94_31835 [Streptomyces sp. NPDC044984]|uniref:hypothetical protein n=1 Tax=Streptomyces sp. NPDC044984 TaxID=3154335 RepID=UPI0033D412B6
MLTRTGPTIHPDHHRGVSETRRGPEKDGYRAQLAVYAGGRVLPRSRRGTEMTTAFPEIRAAALAQLPADTGIDGVM